MTITLKHQEGLQFLSDIPDGSVDLILTDPPYEISRSTGFIDSHGEKTIERFKMSYEFGEWDQRSTNLAPFVSEFYRVLRKGGTMIMFYDLWKLSNLAKIMEENKFKQLRFLEWIKTNPVPINSGINYLTNSREMALSGVKVSKPTFNSKYDNGIYQYPIYHAKDRFHPTQKSLPLFEELINKHSNPGDLVLDCFAGSATTAIAAMNTDRRFTGCELDEEYFNKSIERIERNR
jgi:DNA modification methylase